MCEKGEKENTKNTQLKNAGNGRGSQTEGPRQKDAQMHITQKRKQEGTCQFGSTRGKKLEKKSESSRRIRAARKQVARVQDS